MAHVIGQVFWLALAVTVTGILHMAVVKKNLFAALCVPIDGGRLIGGVAIFGASKTWRGVVVMTLGSALFGALQGLAFGAWAHANGIEVIDFVRLGGSSGPLAFAAGYFLFNAVLGIGYVLGELPNSFVKRRIGIVPGKTSSGVVGGLFFLVDQADSAVFALGLAMLCFPYPLGVFVVGVLCLTALHLLLNAAMYAGRLRRNL
jgi:hypothetical protein